ncbi:MAG TPA: hypothetical protein VGV92_00825 [Gammaproteobacteria bacterium]|nr:hypothetical protein [Gammaproteobacteria bacterium]
MNSHGKHAIIAAVIAGLFATESYAATTSSTTPAPTPAVKCMGVHNCKSMGACKSGANGCGGKNACRAIDPKSIVTNLTAQQCDDKGGTVVQ